MTRGGGPNVRQVCLWGGLSIVGLHLQQFIIFYFLFFSLFYFYCVIYLLFATTTYKSWYIQHFEYTNK